MLATTSVTSDLARAVDISNRIQTIARQTFEMRLQATNAVVMTRSRGVAVPGFDAVARQMGDTSCQLAREIEPLRVATVAWIRCVSARIRVARELAMLDLARIAAPADADRIERITRPLRARLSSRDDSEQERRAFMCAVDDVRQTVSAGCVLARTAKIEAAYGGDISASLEETASTFTQIADAIDESVRTITRWIGTSQRRTA